MVIVLMCCYLNQITNSINYTSESKDGHDITHTNNKKTKRKLKGQKIPRTLNKLFFEKKLFFVNCQLAGKM